MADAKSQSQTQTGSSSDVYVTKSQAVSFAASGLNTVLNSIASYNNAKHNYQITKKNAISFLEQTENEIDLINLEYEQEKASNEAIIANSGMEASTYTDVMRASLDQKERTVSEMRKYAYKQYKEAMKEAARARAQAKKNKNAALLGGGLGAVAGFIIGGPAGAAAGGSIGSGLGTGLAAL